MKRIRWFSADWPVSMRTLATKMRTLPFRADTLEGFLIDRIREDNVGGRYIEKVVFDETVKDPFGDEQVFQRVSYRQLEFNLFAKFPNIELWDSPRSVGSYVSKLQQFSNFEVSIDQLLVDVVDWANAFESAINKKLTIDTVQIAGLEVERGVTARMVLTAEKDVRAALDHLARNKKYELEKMNLTLPLDGRKISVLMTNAGAVRVENAFLDELLPALRRSLPRLRRKAAV